MQFFWQLLTCRRARLALLSQCLGSRSIQVTVLLLLSQLHLDRKRVIPCPGVLLQVYLAQLKRCLPSLPVLLSVLHLHQVSMVVQCLHMGHLHRRHWSLWNQFSVKSTTCSLMKFVYVCVFVSALCLHSPPPKLFSFTCMYIDIIGTTCETL